MAARPINVTAQRVVAALRRITQGTAWDIAAKSGLKLDSVRSALRRLERYGVVVKADRQSVRHGTVWKIGDATYMTALAPWGRTTHEHRIARVASVALRWPGLPLDAIAAVLGATPQALRSEVMRHGRGLVTLTPMDEESAEFVSRLVGGPRMHGTRKTVTVVHAE